MATASSINVRSDNLRNFNEVSTTKHNPKRFEEALSIYAAIYRLSLLMINYYRNTSQQTKQTGVLYKRLSLYSVHF